MEEKVENYRYKDHEEYSLKLNRPPEEGWIKNRTIGGGRSIDYTSIEVKEAIADVIFREWNVVHENYVPVLNEIVGTVKIIALPDYPGADHITFTGSASKPIQCKAGSDPAEFPKGKLPNALQYCLPACRSDAIGCAFESLGNIFGRNVSREASNNYGFNLEYKEKKNEEVPEKVEQKSD